MRSCQFFGKSCQFLNKDKSNCNTLLHLLNVTTSEIGPEMGPEMGLKIVGPDDRYR